MAQAGKATQSEGLCCSIEAEPPRGPRGGACLRTQPTEDAEPGLGPV